MIGVKRLTPTAIILMAGIKQGDSISDQTLDEIRTKLIDSGMFGMHNLEDRDEWVRVRLDKESSPEGHCELIISVDENEPITGVSITGSGPIPIEKVKEKLHTGGIYNAAQFERDRRAIQELYTNRGYVMTYGPEPVLDTDHPGVLQVSISVARVRDIRITGNKATRAFVIRREMKTREGGYYNRSELQEDVKRIASLGIFTDVEPDVSPVGGGQLSINMQIKEAKNRNYNVGSSYGGGALSGFLEVGDSNFRGQDESLRLHIENGVASNRHSYVGTFVEPEIDHYHTSMSLSGYDTTSSVFSNSIGSTSTTGSSGNLVQDKTGGTLRFSRPLPRGLFAATTFRAENIRTDALSLAGSNSARLQDGPLIYTSSELAHSTLDQRLDPVSGDLQKLTLGFGHSDLHSDVSIANPAEVLGSHNFVKSSLDIQHFINLGQPRRPGHPDDQRTTIATRFQIGTISGITPFTEQYFLGGSTGLRGYRDGRFWGQNMASGTIELRKPLSHGIKGVLFGEAGDAWGGQYKSLSLQGLEQSGFRIHASAGLGIRIGTPAGLVRLDYGYGDEGGRVHFGIGYSF